MECLSLSLYVCVCASILVPAGHWIGWQARRDPSRIWEGENSEGGIVIWSGNHQPVEEEKYEIFVEFI